MYLAATLRMQAEELNLDKTGTLADQNVCKYACIDMLLHNSNPLWVSLELLQRLCGAVD